MTTFWIILQKNCPPLRGFLVGHDTLLKCIPLLSKGILSSQRGEDEVEKTENRKKAIKEKAVRPIWSHYWPFSSHLCQTLHCFALTQKVHFRKILSLLVYKKVMSNKGDLQTLPCVEIVLGHHLRTLFFYILC